MRKKGPGPKKGPPGDGAQKGGKVSSTETAEEATGPRIRVRARTLTARTDEIAEILKDPKSKKYKDLRDRAAYLYITGTYPSHLRRFWTRVLTMVSRAHKGPASFDRSGGTREVETDIVSALKLDEHLMVAKVRELIDQKWRIQISLGPNARKPYTKIFLYRGKNQAQKMTVQVDGSTKDHWG